MGALEQWQTPAVVQMRVGQEHEVEGLGVERRRAPVPETQFLQPLEEAAVDEQHPIFKGCVFSAPVDTRDK